MDRVILRLLPDRPAPVLVRYVAATALVGTAAIGHHAFAEPLQHYPLLLFFPAVFLCAMIFDSGTGFFATVLSAVIAATLTVPAAAGGLPTWEQLGPLAIFVLIGFSMAAVTEALRSTVRRLAEAERQKAFMYQELTHRTKNDLAIVISALTLQSKASQDPAVKDALRAAISRIQAVASAHERLRGIGEEALVDLAEYLAGLCGGLGDRLRDVRPIAVHVECEHLHVPGASAVAIGLLVNELVTNSFKYAFPDGAAGTITISAHAIGSRTRIVVADDGVGCPAEARPGLGSRLVQILAKQKGGTVTRQQRDRGCAIEIDLDACGRLVDPRMLAAPSSRQDARAFSGG